jgi:uncharacterized repeat protein (TIGR03803 family)
LLVRKILARGLVLGLLTVSSAALADSTSFLQRLHSFGATGTGGVNADGTGSGQLIVHSNGNVYGVRDNGGTSNAGVLYRMTPAGAVTVLMNFGTALASGQAAAQYPRVLIEDAGGEPEGASSRFQGRVEMFDPMGPMPAFEPRTC